MEGKAKKLEELVRILKGKLTAQQFEDLHETFGITKYRLGTILYRGTEDWYEQEILILSELTEIDPLTLLMDYGIGRKYVTLERADELAAQQGYEVGLLAHVA